MKRYIHAADAVFALVLFCAFAMSMLLILVTGARAYQDVRDATQNRYSENTCVDYIATKVRHYNSGGVDVDNLGGVSVLRLSEEMSGLSFVTYIYFYGGHVRELFVESDYEFNPDDGLDVIEVGKLSFELRQDGLLRVSCTGTGGGEAETYLSVLAGEVA